MMVLRGDLRLGDWREVLADVGEVDAVITDPPFSPRTEHGFMGQGRQGGIKRDVHYGSLDVAECEDVAAWSARTARWWVVVFSDHVLQPTWEKALEGAGFYVFAPLAWVKNDPPPRFLGDGPSSGLEWITVARRRQRLPATRMGSRPPWYKTNISKEHFAGSKPLSLMRAIVRDYTLSGDLVCDLYSGTATTGVAALGLGRRFVGAEIDPETHAKSLARLNGNVQLDLLG